MLPIIIVSKMYQLELVSVKHQLNITKVEVWVNQYLTNTTDTLQKQKIFQNYIFQKILVKHWLISVKHLVTISWEFSSVVIF